MLPQYISVFLMVIGFTTLASAADAPCDGSPFVEGTFMGEKCPDHEGKWVYRVYNTGTCIENEENDVEDEDNIGVWCIKPDYAFNTEAECTAKCMA